MYPYNKYCLNDGMDISVLNGSEDGSLVLLARIQFFFL